MLHGALKLRPCTGTHWLRSAFAALHRRSLLTLAIETSCDDTCVAILSTKDHEPNVSSKPPSAGPQAQLHFHEKITLKNTGHRGIHPVEALESHHANLATLIEKSLECLPEAKVETPKFQQIWNGKGVSKQKPDFISVTRGPGMRSNLYIGLDTAKGLATAWQIPMVGVHHMQAHALTPRLVHALQDTSSGTSLKPEFPFLTLLVSGGHTMLLHSKSLTSHSILANTIDTAIGDCLDKCGRSILPSSIIESIPDTAYAKYLSNYAFPTPGDYAAYPVPARRGDELSKPVNAFGWNFGTPLAGTRDMKFSFAGVPSRTERILSRYRNPNGQMKISDEERLTLARTVLGTAFEHLGSRTIIALESLRDQHKLQPNTDATNDTNIGSNTSTNTSPVPVSTLVVSGGVASNPFLRYFFRSFLDVRGFSDTNLIFPPVELCTDNAAMIAWAGIEMYRAGWRTMLDCDARRKWSMDDNSSVEDVRGEAGNENNQREGAKKEGGILGVEGWVRL